MNQQQRDVIDYLQEENRVLREQLGPRRLRFTDAQRRRLAAKAKTLGRRVLQAHHRECDPGHVAGVAPGVDSLGPYLPPERLGGLLKYYHRPAA
jgi:hypothetical protein